MNILMLALIAGASYLGYRKVIYDPPPLKRIEGPLRPPPAGPGAPSPGPGAVKLQEFLDSLSDLQVHRLRSSIPTAWWKYFEAAVYAPTDQMLAFTLGPIAVDYDLLPDDLKRQLKKDIIASIGWAKAMELKEILEEIGVL